MATRATSSGAQHAAEAHVHRRCARVQERHQIGRKRAVVGQDPRAGLHDVEVRRTRPRAQDRVRRQPRPVGEDVVADVVHRRQADRRPVRVERVTVQRIHALGVHVPQHPVVGLARRERPARPRQRRLVRRRDAAGEEADEHVVDAQLLRNRSHACGHQTGRHHRVTALGRRGDRVELHGDQIRRRPGRVGRRQRLRAVQHLAQRLAHRDQRHADPCQRVPRSPAVRTPAPPRRVPATPRANPINGSTSPRDPQDDNNTRIQLPPSSREFWLRPAILGHDRGLAASPPMRYILKVEGITTPA